MIPVAAGEVAAWVGGSLVGQDCLVGPDVVTDSRLATAGALFVARRGEHSDGHRFVAGAASGGAVAAIVDHMVDVPITQIVVPDVMTAFQVVARHAVEAGLANGLTVLALTGSSGKTSTKDLLAQILEPVGPTVSPLNSYNGQVGLPLTVAGVTSSTRFLVAEMGASHVGEIAALCAIALPFAAAVLNVGHAHIGEFGSQGAIAAAKGEIVEALPPDGWAVLNADDPLVAAMAPRTKASIVWFSATGRPPADARRWVAAQDVVLDDLDRASFTLTGADADTQFALPVRLATLGAHQVANACAAAALAWCAGVAPEAIAAGLNAALPRSGARMELHRLAGGALLLNDAYNANPDSVAAALAALSRLMAARPGCRAGAVLGDMLELGDESASAHRQIGWLAARTGAQVVAVGQFASEIVAGARRADGEAHAMQRADVADWLASKSFDLILVKGSRDTGLRLVVGALVDSQGEEPQ